MPFAVFRRHQRKLLAIFAILAMFAFVASDGLNRLVMPRGTGPDEVVVRLFGRPVYRSEIEGLRAERARANVFLGAVQRELGMVGPGMNPIMNVFGETSTRAIVDALILRHEADALGMPISPEIALKWLSTVTNDRFTPTVGDRIVGQQFKSQGVSGHQILSDIADQIRLLNARRLPGPAEVTPLDVFRAFRDQNEKVAVQAVPVRVADFVAKVPDPADAEIRAFYEKYKDTLPDPARPAPGFTTPRRVELETLSLDASALERSYRAKLTEKELRDAYDERKADLAKSNPMTDELPVDLFAEDPEAKITPRTFEDARPTLENELVEAKVQAEIERRFNEARKAMDDYSNAYQEAAHPASDEDDAEKARRAASPPPEPPRLKEIAARLGLTYEKTPLLTREELAKLGTICRSHVGLTPGGRNRSFVAEVLDPKTDRFTSIELSDDLGRYFLAWKTEDQPPRTPPLDEIRKEVVAAWKLDQARPLARKAAQELAEAARKQGGDLRAVAKDRVFTTEPVTKLVASPLPGQFRLAARPGEIPRIPNAGDALREAIFELPDKAVAVEPDQPQATYYVLTVAQRLPSTFRDLYAPFSERPFLERQTFDEANSRRMESWMADLRARAGLNPEWSPPHETERRDSRPEDSDEAS